MMSEYPVEEHPTWDIIDSTKLQDFIACERMYFYRYMLGWQGEGPNVHLVFGEAWHRAMEHLLLNGYGSRAIVEAFEIGDSYYRKHFPEIMDEVNHPKIPGVMLLALEQYANTYKEDWEDQEVLYTEIAGTVPIEDRLLHFRQDAILRTKGGIISREHKTGSQLSRMWRDQWHLSTQIGTYAHVLYCLYPPEEVEGVVINGAIFNKTKVQFERIPIRKRPIDMQVWYWNTAHFMEMIEWETERLVGCKDSDDVMMAFPMRNQSCTRYFGCPYHDFCMAWPNPLQHVDELPMGFEVKRWDPSEKEAKHKMTL